MAVVDMVVILFKCVADMALEFRNVAKRGQDAVDDRQTRWVKEEKEGDGYVTDFQGPQRTQTSVDDLLGKQINKQSNA